MRDQRQKQSYPSIVWVSIIRWRLSVDQKIGGYELIIALKAMIMILRIRGRKKLLRRGIQLCEHVNQLLHTEFRFWLWFWVHFVGISGNVVSNRSHGNQSHTHPTKKPSTIWYTQASKKDILRPVMKRNSVNWKRFPCSAEPQKNKNKNVEFTEAEMWSSVFKSALL